MSRPVTLTGQHQVMEKKATISKVGRHKKVRTIPVPVVAVPPKAQVASDGNGKFVFEDG